MADASAVEGLSDGEAEKEAKRPCSASTTPKSGRGLDPSEYDRLMEVDSAESATGAGKNGEQTDTENPNPGVANDTTNLDSGSVVSRSPWLE